MVTSCNAPKALKLSGGTVLAPAGSHGNVSHPPRCFNAYEAQEILGVPMTRILEFVTWSYRSPQRFFFFTFFYFFFWVFSQENYFLPFLWCVFPGKLLFTFFLVCFPTKMMKKPKSSNFFSRESD